MEAPRWPWSPYITPKSHRFWKLYSNEHVSYLDCKVCALRWAPSRHCRTLSFFLTPLGSSVKNKVAAHPGQSYGPSIIFRSKTCTENLFTGKYLIEFTATSEAQGRDHACLLTILLRCLLPSFLFLSKHLFITHSALRCLGMAEALLFVVRLPGGYFPWV